MSIYVSFVSALSIVSAPGEVYKYGNALLWQVLVIPVVVAFSCYTILPVFYRTKSESVYTYLELRFGTFVSHACLAFAQVSWGAYIAVCILSPALAIDRDSHYLVYDEIYLSLALESI